MRTRLAAWCEDMPGVAIPVFSVAAGFAATAAGAAASLLVQGPAVKIIVWVAVTAVVAIVAGFLYPVPRWDD